MITWERGTETHPRTGLSMQLKLLGTTSLPIDSKIQWIACLPGQKAFATGDEKKAFLVRPDRPGVAEPITRAPASGAFNLPLSTELAEDFCARPWRGLRFLSPNEYAVAVDLKKQSVGDVLRTLVFLPDYGTYLQHPQSRLILSLKCGSIGLLEKTSGGFKAIDLTRTRGKSTLAFAAHPTETLLTYGDNAGTFHAHPFDQSGFGKASKIAAKERKASQCEFIADGKTLVIGGMGYLSTFTYDGGKFSESHNLPIAVREFAWIEPSNRVFVNQGMHGISTYQYDDKGFTKLADLQAGQPVQQLVASADGKFIAASHEGSVSLIAVAE